MKKIANVLSTIFSVGVLLTLVAGGISVIGFIAALCIGGDTAMELCRLIHKEYFPWVIKATSVFVAFGLVSMYLEKKKALVMETEDIHNVKPKDRK